MTFALAITLLLRNSSDCVSHNFRSKSLKRNKKIWDSQDKQRDIREMEALSVFKTHGVIFLTTTVGRAKTF